MHEMKIETSRILDPALSPYHTGEKAKEHSTLKKRGLRFFLNFLSFNLVRAPEARSKPRHCTNFGKNARFLMHLDHTIVLFLHVFYCIIQH